MHNHSNLSIILAAINCHMDSQSRCENNQAYWEEILLWSKLKVKVDYRGTSWRPGPTWSCAAWSWTSARSRCSRAARTAAGRRAAKAEPFAAEASRLLERKEKILFVSASRHTGSIAKMQNCSDPFLSEQDLNEHPWTIRYLTIAEWWLSQSKDTYDPCA